MRRLPLTDHPQSRLVVGWVTTRLLCPRHGSPHRGVDGWKALSTPPGYPVMRSPGWCSGPSYDPVTVVTRVQIPPRAYFCGDPASRKYPRRDSKWTTSDHRERSRRGSNPASGAPTERRYRAARLSSFAVKCIECNEPASRYGRLGSATHRYRPLQSGPHTFTWRFALATPSRTRHDRPQNLIPRGYYA